MDKIYEQAFRRKRGRRQQLGELFIPPAPPPTREGLHSKDAFGSKSENYRPLPAGTCGTYLWKKWYSGGKLTGGEYLFFSRLSIFPGARSTYELLLREKVIGGGGDWLREWKNSDDYGPSYVVRA